MAMSGITDTAAVPANTMPVASANEVTIDNGSRVPEEGKTRQEVSSAVNSPRP